MHPVTGGLFAALKNLIVKAVIWGVLSVKTAELLIRCFGLVSV